ncbi:anthrone oxygenase family protein [Streptosporangium sp. NPDC023825]|uniref:anthrone oxygenase family protein n=1 Tax=Streptosporangium sp. NPDC023825 TaxID=3154909 RepID=UPI003447119B
MTTGLMAGLFAGFAYSVMPGLGRSSDRTLIEAMQNINKAIVNPAFMLPFMGSIPLLALAAVMAWHDHGRSALPWIVAALLLYLVAFGITGAVNVPLNDRLAKVTPLRDGDALAMAREHFENRWVTWNLVRALLHTAAFGCLAWALVAHGAARIHPDPGRGQPAVPGHHHLATETR